MRLVKPSYEVRTDLRDALRQVEAAGRCCYKSEQRIGEDTADPFCRMLIKRGHESVIEHAIITVKFVIDRGVSHELVRHRLCSFSQESTRYCDYAPGGKTAGITFVLPPWFPSGIIEPCQLDDDGWYKHFDRWDIMRDAADEACPGAADWLDALKYAERQYNQLRTRGWKPEQARSVLPNSLKTEIVVTANLREWRHIFKLRTAEAAHPQMREIMCPLRDELADKLPSIFGQE
jgi:thymidylate synthase (FAD)